MKRIAIIAAGGLGSRVGNEVPKQFLLLDGHIPVLEYSLKAFERNRKTEIIMAALPPSYLAEYGKSLKQKYPKLKNLVKAGQTRHESVVNCINAIQDEDALVLIHDAARPFINQKIIDDCWKALNKSSCCLTALQNHDTLYQIDGSSIKLIGDRTSFYFAQTPQGFHLRVLLDALRNHPPNFNPTDEISFLLSMQNIDIQIIEGDKLNFKITNKPDFDTAVVLSKIIGKNYDL